MSIRNLLSPQVNSLVARLDSVLRNSKLVDEIKLLLSESEQTKFGLTGTGEESIFKSFASMPVLSVGPYTAPQWKSAVREFNRAMQPAESQASSLLKNRIFSLADRPQLLVAEFRNFEQLLLRPSVSKELDSERETLLGQLLAHLEILRNEFESHGQCNLHTSITSLPNAFDLFLFVFFSARAQQHPSHGGQL